MAAPVKGNLKRTIRELDDNGVSRAAGIPLNASRRRRCPQFTTTRDQELKTPRELEELVDNLHVGEGNAQTREQQQENGLFAVGTTSPTMNFVNWDSPGSSMEVQPPSSPLLLLPPSPKHPSLIHSPARPYSGTRSSRPVPPVEHFRATHGSPVNGAGDVVRTRSGWGYRRSASRTKPDPQYSRRYCAQWTQWMTDRLKSAAS